MHTDRDHAGAAGTALAGLAIVIVTICAASSSAAAGIVLCGLPVDITVPISTVSTVLASAGRAGATISVAISGAASSAAAV